MLVHRQHHRVALPGGVALSTRQQLGMMLESLGIAYHSKPIVQTGFQCSLHLGMP